MRDEELLPEEWRTLCRWRFVLAPDDLDLDALFTRIELDQLHEERWG